MRILQKIFIRQQGAYCDKPPATSFSALHLCLKAIVVACFFHIALDVAQAQTVDVKESELYSKLSRRYQSTNDWLRDFPVDQAIQLKFGEAQQAQYWIIAPDDEYYSKFLVQAIFDAKDLNGSVYVYLLPFALLSPPASGSDPKSSEVAAQGLQVTQEIWCANNRAAALKNAATRKDHPANAPKNTPRSCDLSAVMKTVRTAKALGIDGLPVGFAGGKYSPGSPDVKRVNLSGLFVPLNQNKPATESNNGFGVEKIVF